MGRGARRRALSAWFGLWNELKSKAEGWPEEERSPAVPALREAARRRGVDLERLVRRVCEVLATIDQGRLLETAEEDASILSILDNVERQRDLAEVVIEEIENGGPDGLPDRAYFAVDGFEIDGPTPSDPPREGTQAAV